MRDPIAELKSQILTEIKEFLAKTASAQLSEIDSDTSLLNSGVLDSLAILELMTFLSDKMRVELEDEDFVPENLETVGSLVRFVVQKRRCTTL